MTYTWDATVWTGDAEHADHRTDGAGRLPQQYARSVRLQAWLDAFLQQIQSLEDLLIDVLTMRSVYTAEGVQLDTIGDIVVQPRGELSDDAYRVFLLGKIYANRANGKTPQINELLSDILGLSSVSVREYWPAAVGIHACDVPNHDPVARLLELVVGGGIHYSFDFSAVSVDNTLTFSSAIDAEETDADQGMGDLLSETGDGGEISGSRIR